MLLAISGIWAASPALHWEQLAPLPNRRGLAGAYAGVSNDALLVAGGANFPSKMPWEGGRKKWHDPVFVLDKPDGRWRQAGRLPRPLAYGVSVSFEDAVICAGGCDAVRHYAEVFRLQLRGRRLVTTPLPSLPLPLAYMSGALVGQLLHIAGGTEIPGEQEALSRCFVLDLGTPDSMWRELEPFPGPPRLLAGAAAHDGTFFLFSGAALEPNTDGRVARVYLRDAWRHQPDHGWTRLADLPQPAVAAPTPAPSLGGCLLLLAGDDGSRAGFQPPHQHPGFPGNVLAYDPARDLWSDAGEVPAPRATAPCVRWRGGFVIPSGEVRPGVRSPQVWRLACKDAVGDGPEK